MSIKKAIFKIVSPLWVRLYLNNFSNSFINPKRYYGYCIVYFNEYLPKPLYSHRKYFNQEQRSFGEDSFTVMWYLLFKKFKFKNFLEIGVYRGQVISLLKLMAKENNQNIDVTGISPLIDANDSVSSYIQIDYEADIYQHFKHFELEKPTLVKEYSTSSKALETIAHTTWDCIYVDGSHDEEIVMQDFENTFPYLKQGGILIFDDASFNLATSEYYGEFKGHAGPSNIVDTLVAKRMKEILRVGHNRCFVKL